ncbi:ATP-binding cassette domain-containing protein [Nocardia sp. NPDC057227]|uniref:ATP-binding cassette domain-containing protein n=1 Tax=Nocardia sp. NPDC057227 TaxID=3346056 RepID=UPI0036302CB5
MTSALSISALHKGFGDQPVLRGLDLKVAAGTVFSLLGPNGAGKTTLVRILATLAAPDRGSARVFGHDVVTEADAVRALIGVTGQYSAVDGVLTARENLRLTGRLLHLPGPETARRSAELLDRFDLADAADRRTAGFSGGMRRRLDLAMSLMGEPRMVFLDEPTTGLDPRSRRELWAVIQGLAADGATVFLTTQYLEEADQLADRIAVLDNGAVVADGTPDELKQRAPGGHLRLRFATADELGAARAALPLPDGWRAEPEQLVLQVPSDGSAAEVRALLNRCAELGIEVARLTVHTPDLDDVFFALTGHPAPAEAA